MIKQAGGVLPVGSKQYIEIRRGDNTLQLDLLQFASNGDFARNPYVTNNDVIFVPLLSDFVTVSGAVARPGTFEVRDSRNLKDVIEALGGLSVYADQRSPVRVSRVESDGSRKQYLVDLKPSDSSGKSRPSVDKFPLQHGDEVFVPSSRILVPSQSETIYVTGEVKLPGPKPYRISVPVEEYLGAAGGLTQRANFANAVIYRSDGSTIRVTPRVSIEPGDTIYVPERTFKFWQDHLSIVTTFITLATSIIVLSGR